MVSAVLFSFSSLSPSVAVGFSCCGCCGPCESSPFVSSSVLFGVSIISSTFGSSWSFFVSSFIGVGLVGFTGVLGVSGVSGSVGSSVITGVTG